VDLSIKLRDDFVTRALITRHLEAIGDAYSQNWSYSRIRGDEDPFVSIKGSCTVPAGLTWDLGYGVEEVEIASEGDLTSGQWDGSDTGFYASVMTETNFISSDDYQSRSTFDLVKAYPCRPIRSLLPYLPPFLNCY
jgi:hypothetical protein